MYDNYHYPAGADDENAPWNQPEEEQKTITVAADIELSLKKNINVEVTDYIAEEWHDVEYEDGELVRTGGIDCYIDDCDIEGAYNRQHNSITQLLGILADKEKKELAEIEESIKSMTDEREIKTAKLKIELLKGIISDCEGWEITYTEFSNTEIV